MRKTPVLLTIILLTLCDLLMAAPQYLIDARGGWNGADVARVVVRAVPDITRAEAWTGSVAVEGGELADVRLRAKDGRSDTPGATLDGHAFAVEAGQPTPDIVAELTGDRQTRIAFTIADDAASATLGDLIANDREQAPAAGGSVRLLLTFVYPVDDPQPIRTLKPIRSATPLVVGGQARCVIAVPADGTRDDLARELADALSAAGEAPRIVRAEDLIDEHLQPNEQALSASEVIAIGDTFDNRVLGALWGRGQALASQLYPGPGGYVIRTAHDPWGLGHNVLVLAGSDAEGVAKAVRRFIEGHIPAGGDVVLAAPVVEVEHHWVEHPGVPTQWPKRMPQLRTLDELRERVISAGLMDQDGNFERLDGEPNAVVSTVFGTLDWLGEAWWFQGLDELPPLMGGIVETNIDALEGFHARPTEEMESGLTGVTATWDIIEELPVFSDRARLAVTNVILSQARLGHEPRSMHTLIREGARQIHDENHGTNSALNDFVAWSYFDRDYDLPDSAYWMEMIDALFRGQAGSFQVAEDAASYNTACPDDTMIYAYARPNLQYLERGVARHICDFFLSAGVNNLGLMTGFGDSGGVVPVGYFQNFALANYYYRDGRYRWALENLLHKNSGLRAYSAHLPLPADLAPVEPTDLIGIRPEWIYDRPVDKGGGRLVPVYLPEAPRPDHSFNKVALREAWGADRQYLLISGMKRDGHSQNDVNAIVNLTDNGRMWLVDHEYGLRRGADHSGIVAMQDGKFVEAASQASVDELADFPTTGILSTSVRLGDLDWKRNILWLKGGWYAVLDDLTAGNPAEYVMRASWRGLGAEELLGDRMVLSQGDEQYHVITDGRGSTDLQRVPFASDSEWRGFYDRDVEPVAKVLRDDRVEDLQAGDTARFAAVLAPGSAQADVVRLDGPVAAVVADGDRWLAATGPFSLDGISFDGTQAIIGESSVSVADATSLSISGEALLTSATPVSLTVDLASGQVRLADGSEPATITWRGRQVALASAQPAKVDVAGIAQSLGNGPGAAIAAAFEAKRAGLEQAPPASTYFGVESVASIKFDSPVTAVVAAGSGAVVGLADGSVALLDDRDGVLWRWQAETPITAVVAADLDGDGVLEAVAGSEDGQLTALRDGGVLWQFAMRPSDRASYCHAKMLVAGDLDQDGSPEILAVGPFLHCLNADGTEKWQDHYAFWRNMWRTDGECASIGDLTGDGMLDVVISYVDGYSGTRTLGPDGEQLMPRRDQFAPSHIDHGAPAANLAADINDDGLADVIVGYDGGLMTFPYDAVKYASYLGMGSVLHLAAGVAPEHEPLILATNDMGDLRGLYHREGDEEYRLRAAWRVNMREPITSLAAADLDGDGMTEAVVGTGRGNVRVVSAAGESAAFADSNSGAVAGLCITGDTGAPQITVGRSDGTVERLRLTR